MKRTIISLLTICFVCLAKSQTIGTWQIYPAYTVCTKNIPTDGKIYGLMESKLMAYDPEDETLSTFDWHHQLNGISISHLHYSASAHRLILIYDDGNIDLLSTQNDNDVINLAQLKNSTLQNKQVQNVQVSGNMAYVCTGFGVLCIDLMQGIITNTYNLGLSVTSCATTDDAIYLGTTSGVWKGDFSQNLKEKSNWQQIHPTLMALRMEYFDGRLWAQQYSSVYISDETISTFSMLQKMQATFMNLSDNSIILGNSTQTFIYTSATQYTSYTGTFTWSDLRKQGSTYWASDGAAGLQAYELSESGSFQLKTSKLQYNSPLHDYSLYFFQHRT